MMHIFLTGGSGFFGRRLIARLTADGHAVHALARTANAANAVRHAGAQPVDGDLADLAGQDARPRWLNVLGNVDAVIHAAAFMEFWGPDKLFVERNLLPTRRLYAAAVSAKVSRFVLISAASVTTGTNRDPIIDEASDTGRPNIAYSRVKLRTEQELLAIPHRSTSLVILRPPYVWGEGMTHTLQGFIDAAQSGRFSWIDGGRHTVEFCHVDNLAHATTLALTHGDHGLVCYITDGAPRSAREFFIPLLATRGVDLSRANSVPHAIASPLATIMQTAAKALRRRTPPPLTQWIVSFMGRDRSYDITRARTELTYRPQVTVEEGLARLGATTPRSTHSRH